MDSDFVGWELKEMSVALAVLVCGMGNVVLAAEPSVASSFGAELPPPDGALIEAKLSESDSASLITAPAHTTSDAAVFSSTESSPEHQEASGATAPASAPNVAEPSKPEDNLRVRAGMLSDVERGGLVYYGTFGYPELRVGFRQGMKGFELGGEVGFDYTLSDLWFVVSGRTKIWNGGNKSFSAGGQLGAFGSFGTEWLDDRNQPGQGIRFQADAIFTHKFSIPLLFSAKARLPLEVPVSSCGLLRFGLLVGAGIEVALTDQFIISVDASVGPMLWHPYGGVSYGVFAYDVTVGLGFRLF